MLLVIGRKSVGVLQNELIAHHFSQHHPYQFGTIGIILYQKNSYGFIVHVLTPF